MRHQRLKASSRRSFRRWVVIAAVVWAVVLAQPASAHNLDSSLVEVQIDYSNVRVHLSVAVEAVDQALGTHYLSDDSAVANEAIVSYLADHLELVAADGSVWEPTVGVPERSIVEGFTVVDVVAEYDTEGANTAVFDLTFDGIIEALPAHTAVVVVIDSNDDVGTAGIITSESPTVTVRDGERSVPFRQMVRYGFHHVVDGADHVLFLLTLLLPAPLVVAARQWRRGPGLWAATSKVVHVVTAFTIGHSITLAASALGWLTPPAQPVELAIAVSVAVSALHAIRPLATNGEAIIAGGFGLVHGLAFAGILADLGLQGSTSVLNLLAFNIGIEIAQLASMALVFPSLYVLSRTRCYRWVRVGGAVFALAAALGWIVDRLGLSSNPLAPVEELAITHPWSVVVAVGVFAAAAWILDDVLGVDRASREDLPAGS